MFQGNYDFDMLVFREGNGIDGPDEHLTSYLLTRSAKNWGQFSNADVDKLLNDQAKTLDPVAHLAIVDQVRTKLQDLFPGRPHQLWGVLGGVVAFYKAYRERPSTWTHKRYDYVWLDK